MDQEFSLYYYSYGNMINYTNRRLGIKGYYRDISTAFADFKRASNNSDEQILLVAKKPNNRIIAIKFFDETGQRWSNELREATYEH